MRACYIHTPKWLITVSALVNIGYVTLHIMRVRHLGMYRLRQTNSQLRRARSEGSPRWGRNRRCLCMKRGACRHCSSSGAGRWLPFGTPSCLHVPATNVCVYVCVCVCVCVGDIMYIYVYIYIYLLFTYFFDGRLGVNLAHLPHDDRIVPMLT
jgi:hypothetical protein